MPALRRRDAPRAMTALPRTSFGSSPLVRLLAGLDPAGTAPPRQAPAERWSQWLDWTDAIALAGVLGTGPDRAMAPVSRPRGHDPARVDARRDDAGRGDSRHADPARAAASGLGRLRAELAHGIRNDPAFGPATTASDAFDQPDWRRRYGAWQRAMEARIGPVREEARVLLARQSADGARLAALDAVLDKALAARERHLLSGVPQRLAGRPGRKGAVADAVEPTDGALAQAALLAELDLRLQPVEGLVDALAACTAPTGARPA